MTRNSSGPSSATITRAEGSEAAAAAGWPMVPPAARPGDGSEPARRSSEKIRLRAPMPVSSTAAFKRGVPCNSDDRRNAPT